jgi:hypothetical protein
MGALRLFSGLVPRHRRTGAKKKRDFEPKSSYFLKNLTDLAFENLHFQSIQMHFPLMEIHRKSMEIHF